MQRRGILAAAGAAVAAILAKHAADATPVAADGGTWTFPYSGTASSPSPLVTVNNTGSGAGISGTGSTGVYGDGGAYGVYGTSSSLGGIGVYAYGRLAGVSASSGIGYGVSASSGTGYGVSAATYATAASGAAGVYGQGSGVEGNYGVLGVGGGGGTAVQGQDARYGVVGKVRNMANTVAVYGQNESATGSNNIGVYGASNTGYGVLGVSNAGGGYSGITGAVYTSTGAAFAGGAANPSAFAAYFTGKVNIDGPFFVNGVQRYTLKHADGSARLVSGALSVEPMVEDFGTGQLTNGAATVALDADFRDVADVGNYRVFVMPEGDCRGLYVANKGAAGFEVRELQGGTSGVAFAYRVVARPKDGGGKIARLTKYERPSITIPGIDGGPLPPDAPPDAPPPKAPPPVPQPRAASPPASSPAPHTATPPQPSATPSAPQPAPAPRA